MENQHLTYFKVENFKKFNSLEVKDIGQFNLIVGDNNVGKTVFLESLLMTEKNIDRSIENLHHTLCRRLLHIHPYNIRSENPRLPEENYFDFLKNDKNIESISFNWNNYKIAFKDIQISKLVEQDFKKELKHNYNIGRPNLWVKIYLNDLYEELQFMYLDDFKTKFDHGYLPIINKNAGYGKDLNDLFKEIEFENLVLIKESLKNLFFEDFEDLFKRYFFNRELFAIKLKRFNDFVPITYFGDGFIEFLRYAIEIIKSKNSKLMIDEIANGIHYSRLKDFWLNIMKICKELNVQLFATTHSKECEIAFAEALKEIKEEKNGRLISLQEEKKGIKSYVYQIENLDLDYEYRG